MQAVKKIKYKSSSLSFLMHFNKFLHWSRFEKWLFEYVSIDFKEPSL